MCFNHLNPTKRNWDWLPCSFWQSGSRPWHIPWSAGHLEWGQKSGWSLNCWSKCPFHLILSGWSPFDEHILVLCLKCHLNWPKASDMPSSWEPMGWENQWILKYCFFLRFLPICATTYWMMEARRWLVHQSLFPTSSLRRGWIQSRQVAASMLLFFLDKICLNTVE